MISLDKALTIAKKRFCQPPDKLPEMSDLPEVAADATLEKEDVEGNYLVTRQLFIIVTVIIVIFVQKIYY
jgi:hypothetical protein